MTIHDYYDIGTAVALGDVTARLHYIHAKNDNAATGRRVSDVDSFGVGMDARWGARSTATVAYYHNRYDSERGDSTTKSLVLSNDVALSKRTVLYVQLAYEDADDAVNPADPLEYLKRTIVVGGSAPAGKETSILSLGVMHNF